RRLEDGNHLLLSRSLHQRVPDLKPNRLQFAAHLVIPETQHFDALRSEELVSLLIPRPLIREAVTAAVQFDGQLGARAVEIEEVDTARVLATELEVAETAISKQAPETLLRVGGFLAEVTGKVAGSGCASPAFAIAPPPHPSPLPRWGRGDRK